MKTPLEKIIDLSWLQIMRMCISRPLANSKMSDAQITFTNEQKVTLTFAERQLSTA